MKTHTLGQYDWIALFGIGLLVYGFAAVSIQNPGYMDADYYFAIGLQLVDGQGLTEPFLWNYLDDPDGLPHVAHLYWMPLPSLISAAGMWLTGLGFRGAQLPFVLLAAILPPLSAYYGDRLSRDRRSAWMAGLFAALPGFYLPFLVTTDSFAVFAIVGSLSLWMMASSIKDPLPGRWFLAGLLVAVSSLARADGLLLLLIGVIAVISAGSRRIFSGTMLGLGFLALMLPWWIRNYVTAGSMLNPGSQRLLWMINYNDLFAYPGSQLTAERWLDTGLQLAAQARLEALLTNLQRLIAEGGFVFLAPFIVIGAVQMWKHAFVRLSAIYLAALFIAMTVVFPFVGPRGALFHSMAAVMPLFWALTPVGLKIAIDWLGRKRDWDRREAWRVLGGGAVVLAAVTTFGLFANRFYLEEDTWHAGAETYKQVAREIPAMSASVVAVNNPPGFFAHSHIPAVAIPNGNEDALREVVEAFDVGWVVLEKNHPPDLDALYANPRSTRWLILRETLNMADGQPVYVLEVVQ